MQLGGLIRSREVSLAASGVDVDARHTGFGTLAACWHMPVALLRLINVSDSGQLDRAAPLTLMRRSLHLLHAIRTFLGRALEMTGVDCSGDTDIIDNATTYVHCVSSVDKKSAGGGGEARAQAASLSDCSASKCVLP